MIVSLEKPCTPQELVHVGVKGMHWGIRKSEESSNSASTPKKGMSTKKKVAIGGAVLVGAAVTMVVLRKTGHLQVSPLSNRHPTVIRDLLKEHGEVKMSNLTRASRPDLYVRNPSGNYIPRSPSARAASEFYKRVK